MPHKLKLRDRQGGDLLRLAGTAAEVIFAVVPGAVEAEAGTGGGTGAGGPASWSWPAQFPKHPCQSS